MRRFCALFLTVLFAAEPYYLPSRPLNRKVRGPQHQQLPKLQ